MRQRPGREGPCYCAKDFGFYSEYNEMPPNGFLKIQV